MISIITAIIDYSLATHNFSKNAAVKILNEKKTLVIQNLKSNFRNDKSALKIHKFPFDLMMIEYK